MNHVHPVIYKLTEEQAEEAMEILEVDNADDIAAISHPSIVVCPLCKESFETVLDEHAPN